MQLRSNRKMWRCLVVIIPLNLWKILVLSIGPNNTVVLQGLTTNHEFGFSPIISSLSPACNLNHSLHPTVPKNQCLKKLKISKPNITPFYLKAGSLSSLTHPTTASHHQSTIVRRPWQAVASTSLCLSLPSSSRRPLQQNASSSPHCCSRREHCSTPATTVLTAIKC